MTEPRRSYDPLVPVRRPGGKPDEKPRFRVLIHKRLSDKWDSMVERVGAQSSERLWDHLAFRADQKPLVGSVTPLKGRHMAGKDGWSRVYHYEVSGAGRVNYQYHPEYDRGSQGDPHAVVNIISINMSSH